MKPLSLSVFIPMYNEEINAGIIIPELLKVLEEITDDFEVIIIDDASRDRTVPLVQDYMKRDSRIRLLQHQQNQGYGRTLATGFLSSTKDVVFYTDADVPIDFKVLKEVFPLMQKEKAVIGYRIDRADTIKRWIFSTIYNRILRLFFSVHVRDINFSFKMFHRSVVEHFSPRLGARSVFVDGEILIWVIRGGYAIHEIPIEYFPRKHGLSTLGSWRQALHTFREITRFIRRGKLTPHSPIDIVEVEEEMDKRETVKSKV